LDIEFWDLESARDRCSSFCAIPNLEIYVSLQNQVTMKHFSARTSRFELQERDFASSLLIFCASILDGGASGFGVLAPTLTIASMTSQQ